MMGPESKQRDELSHPGSCSGLILRFTRGCKLDLVLLALEKVGLTGG